MTRDVQGAKAISASGLRGDAETKSAQAVNEKGGERKVVGPRGGRKITIINPAME